METPDNFLRVSASPTNIDSLVQQGGYYPVDAATRLAGSIGQLVDPRNIHPTDMTEWQPQPVPQPEVTMMSRVREAARWVGNLASSVFSADSRVTAVDAHRLELEARHHIRRIM